MKKLPGVRKLTSSFEKKNKLPNYLLDFFKTIFLISFRCYCKRKEMFLTTLMWLNFFFIFLSNRELLKFDQIKCSVVNVRNKASHYCWYKKQYRDRDKNHDRLYQATCFPQSFFRTSGEIRYSVWNV